MYVVITTWPCFASFFHSTRFHRPSVSWRMSLHCHFPRLTIPHCWGLTPFLYLFISLKRDVSTVHLWAFMIRAATSIREHVSLGACLRSSVIEQQDRWVPTVALWWASAGLPVRLPTSIGEDILTSSVALASVCLLDSSHLSCWKLRAGCGCCLSFPNA